MDIRADIEFAKASGEFSRQAPLIRYVAAINPGSTKAGFVAAMVGAGYHPATAAIQFAQSRRESLSCGDVLALADGRLIDNPNWKQTP